MSTYDCSALQWGRLHTAANTINWAPLDTFVTQCKAQGVIQGIFALHGTPTFLAQSGQAATNDPYGLAGGGSYPTDLTHLYYFMNQLAIRNRTVYAGFFTAFQILNEPEANDFSGTLVGEWWGTKQQFVNYRAVAQAGFRAGDSDTGPDGYLRQILTCGMYNVATFISWLPQLAGGSDLASAYPALVGVAGYQTFDAVASHPYWATANSTYPGRGTQGSLPQGGITAIRNALIPYGKGSVEIWCTEFGYDSGGSRQSPSVTVAAWLAQNADQRRIQTIRRFMSGIRHGLKVMCDFSYGGNLLSGDQVADTLGYILGRQQVYAALAGKTWVAAGHYTDGREWILLSDGTVYVV